MINLLKVFRNFRDRVKPTRKWVVKLGVFSEAHQQYIGEMTLTTTARSKRIAEGNIREQVRLHITECWAMKENVNGKSARL
jgi:hypothetical protein